MQSKVLLYSFRHVILWFEKHSALVSTDYNMALDMFLNTFLSKIMED